MQFINLKNRFAFFKLPLLIGAFSTLLIGFDTANKFSKSAPLIATQPRMILQAGSRFQISDRIVGVWGHEPCAYSNESRCIHAVFGLKSKMEVRFYDASGVVVNDTWVLTKISDEHITARTGGGEYATSIDRFPIY